MRLVGQLDSPYVRRVAVTMRILRIDFKQDPLSVFEDAQQMRTINPLGRIPSLILDDGDVLIDSSAILDWLDEKVGADRALIPLAGANRRKALYIMALACGAIDKAIGISYERMHHPAAKIHQPWIDRLSVQLATALTALNDLSPLPWFMGGQIMQPDITTAAMIGYIRLCLPELLPAGKYSNLVDLANRCEQLPAFKKSQPQPENLGGTPQEAAQALLRLQGKALSG